VDCEHLAVELETEPVRLSNSITVSHTLTCVVCKVSARVFEHVATAP
jgi:hypothetical protein